jgi:hypothetical protein
LSNLGVVIILNTSEDTCSNNDYFSYRRAVMRGEIKSGDRVFGRNVSVIKLDDGAVVLI